MTHFRLANVLFASDDFMVQNSELFYRSEGMTRPDSDGSALAFTGEVDFLTYFNAFSNAKWRKYASIDNVWLHLELSGAPCDVVFEELGQDGTLLVPRRHRSRRSQPRQMRRSSMSSCRIRRRRSSASSS